MRSTLPAEAILANLQEDGIDLDSGSHKTLLLTQVGINEVERSGRSNDAAPHWGGAQLQRAGVLNCTSGFTVVNSTGDRAIMAAGHCYNLNETVPNGNNTSSFGKVVFRTFPEPDLLSISTSTYVGRHYSEISDLGGRRVQGALDPALNVGYCQYGSVSLRICTGYVTLNTSFTDSSGTTYNLAQALSAPGCPYGRLSRRGDSGGPVGREVSDGVTGARGLVVGGTSENVTITSTTRCARYDHKWSTIASIFNVSIVNG